MEEQIENKDFMPKAQVEIMLEDIRGDFKVFGEKLEMIDGRLINVENKVEQIDVRLIGVEDRLVNVENRLVAVEEKVDLLAEDMDGVKSNIVDIKTNLKVKAEKEIADDYGNRIVKLEKVTLVTG